MNRKNKLYVCLTILFFFFVFIVSLMSGSYRLTPQEVIRTLFGQGTKLQNTTIFYIRLPRTLAALFVGIGLSAAGSILQTVTKNPLAEPGMIGMNAGASLAVVLLISAGGKVYYSPLSGLGMFLMPICAILGAFFSSFLVYLLSYGKGTAPTRFILMGIGVNAVIQAIITLYQLTMSKGDYNRALTWINGSLWGSSYMNLVYAVPILLSVTMITLYKSRTLDVMVLGNEVASGLGVSLKKEERSFLIQAVLLSAAAASIAGNLAFLGLLAPHMAKRMVGSIHRRQILLGAVIGAALLIGADTLSRNLFLPVEIPVGITLSLLGAPYFIFIMLKEN